jgi:ketol-acid reductoisomerase
VINDSVKQEMSTLLKDIQSGAFADEWMAEHEAGKVRFKKLEEEALSHPIEEVGKRLRGMMPWLQQSRLVDKAKN